MFLACIKAYVPDGADPLHDRLLSPALVPDEVLKRFPPVKIMVGARDPLLDQSIEFAQRLHLLEKDVRLMVYSGFGHGFLSFDNPGQRNAKYLSVTAF